MFHHEHHVGDDDEQQQQQQQESSDTKFSRIRRCLQQQNGLVRVDQHADAGIFVRAARPLHRGQCVVAQSVAVEMALEPGHWQTRCGYCAARTTTTTSRRVVCAQCGVLAFCRRCGHGSHGRRRHVWHQQSGECSLFAALVQVVGQEQLDSTLLLTMRLLLWRTLSRKQNTASSNTPSAPPAPTVDWSLFDSLYASPLPDDDDKEQRKESVQKLLERVQICLVRQSVIIMEPEEAWLSKTEFEVVLARVLGCSHAIIDPRLPLGEQCVGRALFLEHSFYNHECAPNAYLSWDIVHDDEENDNEDGKSSDDNTTNKVLPQDLPSAVSASVHMLRSVAENTPITISYISLSGLDRRERQTKLWQGYHFHCTCDTCSQNKYEEFLKLPDAADADVLRQVQYSCNANLVCIEQHKKAGVAFISNHESQLDHCLSMLQMSQRGIENQGIPSSHEVSLESHRLLAKALHLAGRLSEAMKEHEQFFKKLQPITPLFDPVATATQHVECSRIFRALGDVSSQQQHLLLAIQAATAALGPRHPFITSIQVELDTARDK